MRLIRARVQKYRSIRDTGWFEVEPDKTILVGPNEAGKTVLLQALQQLRAPEGIPGFKPLRDYPRSELNDIQTKKVDPSDVEIVRGHFALDDADRAELSEGYEDCEYVCWTNLDNKRSHRIEGGPELETYGNISKDLTRLAAHVDKQRTNAAAEGEAVASAKDSLAESTKYWQPKSTINSERAASLRSWLESILSDVDESNDTEEARYDKLMEAVRRAELRDAALKTLDKRMPVFVLFNNYFRVRPSIHLGHLADRLRTEVLDDEEYDFGNRCLLKLLGFTAQELSDLGKPAEPDKYDKDALQAYKDQLDERAYKLNAAGIQLTEEIRKAWNPDRNKNEASQLSIRADGQYLKVVVVDEEGVEVELDQRSEGFQWLVSFFVVFFAEAEGKHENSILLLDEPGLSLHGLKQREFRKTLSRLAAENQTLYTTHSPFLVGPSELDIVRVIEMVNRRIGTKAHTTVVADDPAALLPLQEALGYDLAQTLFVQERNLVLEGLTDLWYLDGAAHLLRAGGHADLNEKIALVPAKDAGKVVYYATILHAQKLKGAALLDSDAAGDNAAMHDTLVHTLGNKRILRTKDVYSGQVSKSEIEDLLRDTLVAVAKDDLGWDVSATASTQPGRPIVDIFNDEIPTFSKYHLAKAFLRWTRTHEAADLTDDERGQLVSLVELINKALK
jgi:energy-coupling factor transporter ATP-binding protein EcfA2